VAAETSVAGNSTLTNIPPDLCDAMEWKTLLINKTVWCDV